MEKKHALIEAIVTIAKTPGVTGKSKCASIYRATRSWVSAPTIRARPTVGELIDTYISNARKSLSPSTLASYSRWANSGLKPKWGNLIAEEVTTPDIRTWIADLADEMDNKSIRNCAGLLSAVLNRAAGFLL